MVSTIFDIYFSNDLVSVVNNIFQYSFVSLHISTSLFLVENGS